MRLSVAPLLRYKASAMPHIALVRLKGIPTMGETLIIPGIVDSAELFLSAYPQYADYDVALLDPVCEQDIDMGLAYVDNDACVSVIALVGQFINGLERIDPDRATLVVPSVCEGCRSANPLPVLRAALRHAGWMSRVTLKPVTLRELGFAEQLNDRDETAHFEDSNNDGLRIGVCGPVSMLVADYFTSAIRGRILDSGCEFVSVPIGLLMGADDVMIPALEYFRGCGVETAICLIPFGCLQGNVHARGFMRELRRRYPDIDLTVLDYDPSASDVNVVNRVELVVQSALERQMERGE